MNEYKCYELNDLRILYNKTECAGRNQEAKEKAMKAFEVTENIWNDLIKKEKYHFERDGFLQVEYIKDAPKVKFRRKKEPHGRPKKEILKNINISFRLTSTQMEKLKSNADKRNMSPVEFIINYIDTLREI